jgi:hypothetical protein
MATTCRADSGAMTDCQPICSRPATKLVTMRLHTGRRYTDPLCDRHAKLRAWNDGAPQDHVSTEPIGAV